MIQKGLDVVDIFIQYVLKHASAIMSEVSLETLEEVESILLSLLTLVFILAM